MNQRESLKEKIDTHIISIIEAGEVLSIQDATEKILTLIEEDYIIVDPKTGHSITD